VAAEERRDGEQDDRSREVIAASEKGREKRGHRNHDHVGDHISGHHPGDLIERRAEVAHHLRQRDVDDRRIDQLDHRRQDDRDRDDPLVGRALRRHVRSPFSRRSRRR